MKKPRYAIVTDIHANWPALEAIVTAIAAENTGHENPLRFWFLGDVIGYGPHPIECLNWLRFKAAIDDRWVPGNHDAWLISPEGVSDDATASLTRHRQILDDPFNADVADWFRQALRQAMGPAPTPEDETLKNVEPRSLAREEAKGWKLLFAHASLFGSRRRFYLKAWQEGHLKTEFGYIREEVGPGASAILFCGHAHYPLYAHQLADDRVALQSIRYGTKMDVRPGLNIINPGSAGQPRDGDPRAAYALFDAGEMTIEFRRARYDVEKTIADLKAGGYPDSLGRRLRAGDGMADLAEYQTAYQRPYYDLVAVRSPSPGEPPDGHHGGR